MIKKDGRKQWGEYSVDINLKESWLEELNSLQLIRLLSICEGHPHYLPAHVIIGLKKEHEQLTIDCLDSIIKDIHEKIIELFSGYCYANIASNTKWLSTDKIEKRLYIEIDQKINCRGWDFNSDTEEWFERTIPCIKEFDLFLYSIIERITTCTN